MAPHLPDTTRRPSASPRPAPAVGASVRLRLALGAVLAFLSLGAPLRVAAQFPPVTIVDADPFLGRLYAAGEGTLGVGRALGAAGDANGDGLPDLLIGADGGSDNIPGRAFIVPGSRSGSFLRELGGGHGDIVELWSGAGVADRFGYFVAGAGDVDGDGHDDVLIGMPSQGNPLAPRGGVYLVFGSDRLPERIDLSAPGGGGDGEGGDDHGEGVDAVLFTLSEGAGGGVLGTSGAAAGDLNGDGYGDIAIGFPGGSTGGGGPKRVTGKVWVVFGGPALRSGPRVLEIDTLSSPEVLEISGVDEGSEFGAAVSGVGDLDGDGLDDLALGAPHQGAGGSVFLVFGQPGLAEPPDLGSPDGVSAVELRATIADANLGAALAGGLDTSGDGGVDLLIGAPGAPREGGVAGAGILVAGGASIRSVGVRLVPAAGADVVLRGPIGSGLGSSLALVPDVDGDGLAEALLGAPSLKSGRGAAYLVHGGRDPGREIFLENLEPPDGWMFLANLPGLQLGEAVAGLPDRSGDLLGDFVLGAPGMPVGETEGIGAALEIFRPDDPASPAPRNLAAAPLPGRRVYLTWTVSQDYSYLRVLRDGEPVSPLLPPRVLNYTDAVVEPGRHVYVVEANGDPALRSNQVEIDVRGLEVRHLSCQQREGRETVLVTWALGDDYDALQVFVDRKPASDLLPPTRTQAEVAVPPGRHLIEVYDPTSLPEGERASCDVDVSTPELPEIQGFACSLEPPDDVRLRWTPDPAYDSYRISRNGLRIATVGAAGEYLDSSAPPGGAEYELRGLNRGFHPGPASQCDVDVAPSGDTFLLGTVAWACGGAIRKGTVRALASNGEELSRVQLSSAGEFRLRVEGAGSYRVRYSSTLDAEGLDFLALPPPSMTIVAEAMLSTDVEGAIELPPPAILVASMGPQVTEADVVQRWDPLVTALGEGRLAFPIGLPGGIARGAALLGYQWEDIREYLEGELGSPPGCVDIVAHGAAGLAARAVVADLPDRAVRKLVLLGVPNLGTERAEAEARGEVAARPPRALDVGEDGLRGNGNGGRPRFSGAVEQTPDFLAGLSAQILRARGVEAHVVAGTGGNRRLDALLGCSSHDDRVCDTSALGLPGAIPHIVDENHETLGSGEESLAVILGELEDPSGGGGGEAALLAPALEPDGEAAGVSTYPVGDAYTGVLDPAGSAILPLISDTSESIIIILSSDLPGGIRFRIGTPSGAIVNPEDAGALPNVEYQTYGDGEGHDIQFFRFAPCDLGTYVAFLENPIDNPRIRYTLESYVATDLGLQVSVVPQEVLPGEGTRVLAAVTRKGAPELGGTVDARVSRPDGALEILSLLDDGRGPDEVAGDGVYSADIPPSALPGIHQVEVTASSALQALSPYRREAVVWFRVRSDVLKLTGVFSSGTEDVGGDGVLDHLWIQVGVETADAGIFLATGRLTDLAGNPVAGASTIFSLPGPSQAAFVLYFAGSEIFAAHRDGPYVLDELMVYDGSAGFVPTDSVDGAHTTAALDWLQFGLEPPVQFVRGDSNADGREDISDGIHILGYLFLGDSTIGCLDASDANGDESVNLSDAVYLFTYLFAGGQPPLAPFPACGVGEKPGLGCEAHTPCIQ